MSMLRSSKFVKCFFSFARSIAITQPRGVDGSLVQRSKSLISATQRAYASAPSSSALSAVDRSIRRLDQDVRRAGRISKKELQDVFNEIRMLKQATSTQSLMLIRCCGNLVPEESPEVRTRLVNEIWETFENLGVPFDISHYNALLRVYLENGYQFSPTEFLATLEQKGIEPNRVTFQRLISVYCQKGDIDGAKSILEFMKEKQMPVNESVFNSLIIGHSQCNDMESAVGMISVMKQANLQPSSETYTALLCGYAQHGDIDKIDKVIKECAQNEIELPGKDILEVIYTLATNNHSEHMQPLLEILKECPNFNQDAKNVIFRLLIKGEDRAALEILKVMPFRQSADSDTSFTGYFLIKKLVQLNRSFEEIIEMCQELNKLGNKMALSKATEQSLQLNNPELSLRLLTALSKEDQVCMHYYWPVLVQYGKANNSNGVLNTLRQMAQEMEQQPSNETLRDYVLPYFPSNQLGDDGIQALRQGGISIASAATAMVGHLLLKNQMKQAMKIALKCRANYNSLLLRKALVSAFLTTNDIPTLATFVQIMEENDSEDVEAGGRVLVDIVHNLRSDRSQVLTSILRKYLEHGIGISSDAAEIVQNKLSGDELTQEISTLLTKLSSADITLAELKRPTAVMPRVEQDETTLLNMINNITSRGESPKGLQKQLLILYCQNKDLEKTVKLRDELIKEGFEFNRTVIAQLFDLFVHHEKLDEALNSMKMLNRDDPEFELDASKPVKLAFLMYNLDKFDDAIALLKEYAPSEATSSGFMITSACWKFLNTLAEKKDVERLRILFDTLVDNHYIVPTNVLLGPLIKVHLLTDDIDSGLKVFEECCTKYKATPWKNELACKLIDREDSTNLQRLTDLSTQIHGEVNSLYDLVLSFIECGRIRQARRILETPGLRLRSQRINSACERYTNEGRVKNLESLVQVTKDLKHINRSDIYFHLLNSYKNNGEVDKALGLWTQMQEEDVQPSEQFLITLGTFLQEHNRPVPFQIPQIQEKETKTEAQKKTSPVVSPSRDLKEFRTCIHAQELDRAIELLRTNKLDVKELSNNDKSRLLTLMTNSGRAGEASKLLLDWLEGGHHRPNIKCLNLVINSLAKVGDVDSLNAIGNLISPEAKKLVSFKNRQAHCMVEAGRGEEVFNSLVEEIKSAQTKEEIQMADDNFPRGGIHSILNTMPQLVPKFEELAEIYRSKGVIGPTNALWIYSTINGLEGKAEKSWEHLKSEERLMFQPILQTARKNTDVGLIDRLLEKMRQCRLNSSTFAIVYSCKIDLLLKMDKLSECEKTLEDGLKVCALEDLNRNVLLKLKNATELTGKTFKYSIPDRKVQASVESSSSSSSSSDSDEETKVAAKSN